MFVNKNIPCNTDPIQIILTTTTSQLRAGSEHLGINKDNNIDTNRNLIEGDASRAHSKPFDLDIENVQEKGGSRASLGEERNQDRIKE